MAEKIFIGIDTSNYTTSCAISDSKGNVLHNFKILLPVKEGERGLRQSEAVFAHIKNFNYISQRIRENVGDGEIAAIGYSAYPRDVEGSYMPCFLVGEAISGMLSAFYKVPLHRFSHQSGHIRAAVYSSNASVKDEFIAFHVSGGTTDMLLVSGADRGFAATRIGGTDDLNAGQAIDRIGVMMGLPFPAGPKIEELAGSYLGSFTSKKPKIKELMGVP